MKELEDYERFPTLLRNFQTEFIGFLVVRFRIYKPFIHYLRSRNLPRQPMTDLCSGSGEPARYIFRKCKCFRNLILTDKFPNRIVTRDTRIFYDPKPADVLQMEFEPNTCYTMFNSFHHFNEKEKLAIISKMREAGAHGYFVEILEPRITVLFKILMATTLGNLLLTPLIRPFSFKRLFFTYIIPVNLLTISYDGIVSVFKSYTVKQYQRLFKYHSDVIKVFKVKAKLSSLVIIKIHSK